ncbi:hypothetical protein [Hymenobacter sp. IS2118]|uniref:hypothetical protein n=1 Tax=Hymenobacter sp. IS2118 TaxID=1505605 RepID=UPI0005528B83|nr:hypothetical protein [Hymenobacter sp. IS2118]
MHETYKGRRIIWESKSKQFLLIGGAFLFVASAIWTQQAYSPFAFWFVVIVFGISGCFTLYRLLDMRNLFASPSSKLGIAIRKALDEQALEQVRFYDGGLILTDNPDTVSKRYDWKQLETAFGYKVDRFVTDEICLDLFWKDESILTLSEEMPHWERILAEMSKNIPDIPLRWYIDISVPAFETTLTLLYDKQGRNQTEVEPLCYR